MSTTVSYKNNTITTATNQTKTLLTAGKWLEDDITIIDVTTTNNVTQDQNGYIVLPSTGSGSGNSGSTLTTETGTFTGSNNNLVQISCDFEPREIYIEGDLKGDASLRGVISFTLIKDGALFITSDSSQNNTDEYAGAMVRNITGFNQANSATQPYATYSNGTLTIDTVVNSTSAKFTSGITYSYRLVGFTS